MVPVLLNTRERRRWTRDLSLFLEAVALHLQAGYELHYAWTRAREALGQRFPPGLREALAGESAREVLGRLASAYPVPAHRLWFSLLGSLHGEGAGLVGPVRAFADALRGDLGRELETHCRTLPTRVNLGLMVFFLPPALLLLCLPLLRELERAF